MDIQDPQKNHSSGHESHGVHLCQKCGWPFPNPHPSAKHRRSHKKICGTIEGYTLFNSAASDDEPNFAGIPEVMESCNLEKNIGGVGAVSNRSEDDVFSDAAMEFQDGGFGLGRQDTVADQNDLTPTVSFKDCEDTCDVIPIETEPLMDVLEESRKLGGSDKVAECSVRQNVSEESRKVGGDGEVAKFSVMQETDTEENDVDNLKKNLWGALILPGEHAGEISETVTMSEKRLDGTSGMVLNEVMVQLEEEVSDGPGSKTSINENAEQEVDGNRNSDIINTEENQMNVVESNSEQVSVTSERTDDITSNTRLAGEIVEDKENGDILALDTLVDDLSPKAESAKDIGASLYTSQMLPDAAQITVSDSSFNLNEVYDKTEKEDEVRDRFSHEKSDTSPSNQLNEDNKADTSCTLVAEDSYKLDRNNPAIVKGLVEGDVSKSSSQTDSLNGQWGSVSVLSTRSDNPPATDTENLPSTGSQQLPEPEKAYIKNPTVASGEQQFDKCDEFEPPSFMTLVEPGISDQSTAAPPQASWFPSLTRTINESHGRKNEEIIAKVTNWNAKQHTPLNETKPKSPNTKEPPREGKVAKDQGAMATKVSSILGPESREAEPTDVETVKEWNSPARYQADIKREKRKVKGRPLWAQFVCCAYVK